MNFHGVNVSIEISVLNPDIEETLIPTQEYECFVQPPPFCYDRPQVLEIEVFAMAQIKFINELYTRIGKEDAISNLLDGVPWTVEARLLSFNMREYPIA